MVTEIVIGCDHAAFEAKQKLMDYLIQVGQGRYQIKDLGTYSSERCDYPPIATAVCKEVDEKNVLGILLCGSGIGVSMVANRFKGIRAALVRTEEEAVLSKEHNNSNVLCLGARISSEEELQKIAISWLQSAFAGGRHLQRVKLFDQLGEGHQ
jgi:ribose 5-phosphate isomerase B